MKKHFITLSLLGCSSLLLLGSGVNAKDTTTLKLNVPNSTKLVTKDAKVASDDQGKFTISGKTNDKATVTIKNKTKDQSYQVTANSKGHFSKQLALTAQTKEANYKVTAKAKHDAKSKSLQYTVTNKTQATTKANLTAFKTNLQQSLNNLHSGVDKLAVTDNSKTPTKVVITVDDSINSAPTFAKQKAADSYLAAVQKEASHYGWTTPSVVVQTANQSTMATSNTQNTKMSLAK
ncbi:hypothetical protein BSQ39_09625 [Loigolactobacillus backii]|uniref:Ig-like domain-containing protein n=1 Tax=Loigolactobacillus backii TaxID=375175 RepID=UPI000C1C9395|nr:Ig-like domain-containing protein [Loigolactobacillus backii]PIO83808.1 hypothetical protein BSQ39_09625 [Loigolactobacillus backii]